MTINLFKKCIKLLFIITAFPLIASTEPRIELGVDCFFSEGHDKLFEGKRIGLITNHTGRDRSMCPTIDRFLSSKLRLVALFAPEHGLHGDGYAFEAIADKASGPGGLPVYSLHGKTRRPTEEMLKGIDVLIYDIQDIGCRSYTYTTTLFYAMEEAAKRKIPVIVFDRPNPINGTMVDGPMLASKWRSFIGYVNVPYCHGMTIGELARFFNETYQVACDLTVIPMRGWKRSMTFADTGLTWIPTSPYVPEADTPYYYASTGLLGELSLVNIGIGYTLPFKVIGAPWIRAQPLADALNAQNLPGVTFLPFHYRPFYGAHQQKDCQGVMIVVTNPRTFRPVSSQYMMLGLLKTLYPKEVGDRLNAIDATKKELFCKASGNEEMLQILQKETYVAWKLILFEKQEREQFLKERRKYLLY